MGSSFLVNREFDENDDRESHRSTARGTRMVRSAMSRHIAAYRHGVHPSAHADERVLPRDARAAAFHIRFLSWTGAVL
jgi:hypothetical protein